MVADGYEGAQSLADKSSCAVGGYEITLVGNVFHIERDAPVRIFLSLQAAILAALRKRDGAMVTGEGSPARWTLSNSS